MPLSPGSERGLNADVVMAGASGVEMCAGSSYMVFVSVIASGTSGPMTWPASGSDVAERHATSLVPDVDRGLTVSPSCPGASSATRHFLKSEWTMLTRRLWKTPRYCPQSSSSEVAPVMWALSQTPPPTAAPKPTAGNSSRRPSAPRDARTTTKCQRLPHPECLSPRRFSLEGL